MDNYSKQDRGNLSAYEEYFAGMDASMQQKIALTTAHFPSRGCIADMGSGSGSGTFDLAKLYEHLKLVGVDINPVTVEYSKDHYSLPNLTFETGDIAEKVFENETLDGILNSSVLHHVTSFNGFDAKQIAKTLNNQVAQLKKNGVIIIRDFVVPDEAHKIIFLDLPNDDGKQMGVIPELSTAALFEIFARDFRSSLNLNEGVEYQKEASVRENHSRFRLTLRSAGEFILRKDYRDHWSPELLEEYTYCSQADFENLFGLFNLRIVVSMPLWNPWIVARRFVSKFYLSDLEGTPVYFPPTNYLIVGEKIAKTEGVFILENSTLNDLGTSTASAEEGGNKSAPLDRKPFLKIKAYRNKETNHVCELAERPHQTIDLVPWFEEKDGQLFVLAKKNFPRPVVNSQLPEKHLNRANYSGYLTEPLSAIIQHRDAQIESEIEKILLERAKLSSDEILQISEPAFYFTSAGGIDERVESHLVKISDWQKEPQVIENYTPFTNAGVVRELDALQILRASHVGGMFDARLEINIYRLLSLLKRSPSSWIGADIKPIPQSLNAKIEDKLALEKRESFEPCELQRHHFLKLQRSQFIEYDSSGEHLKTAEFEYIVPQNFSKNTAAAIPFFSTNDESFVGIEYRDLPAAQRFTGNSRLACVPAWRLPRSISHKFEIEPFLLEKFPQGFGVSIRKTWELGGSFFTSAGITPEVVYPIAVELDGESLKETELHFFSLRNLLSKIDQIQDAHLLILLNRLAHALGSLPK